MPQNSNATNTDHVVIVGGGMTGLSSAYFAARAGKKVTLIEANNEVGGLLNTFKIGDNQLEHFYHHFFTHDAELNWLLKELQIQNKIILKSSTMGVFNDGKIYDFNSPIDLLKFKPVTFIDKLMFGFSSIFLSRFSNWETNENISALDWLSKWAGKTAVKAIWEPMLNIKFGPYASKVPLTWMIGRLRQRLGSRNKGDEQLGYMEGSFQVIVDSLVAKLKKLGVEILVNSPVSKINIADQKVTSVTTTNGDITGDQFLFTIPGTVLAKLVKHNVPKLHKQLTDIEYFGAVCVILEMTKPLSHIYWLNIAEKGFPFGGVIEHTNFIGPENYGGKHIAYLSRYFADSEDIATMTNEEISASMISKLSEIYPNFTPADVTNTFVFKTNTAATVCDLNFSQKVPNCQSEIENLYLSNMSHIYPDERSTNNSVRIAAEACNTMGMDTSYVPRNNSLSGKIGFAS